MVRCRLGAQKHRRLSYRHEYRTSLPTLLPGQIDTSIVPHYLLYFMVRCRLGAQKHRRLSYRHEYRTSLPTLLHGQM